MFATRRGSGGTMFCLCCVLLLCFDSTKHLFAATEAPNVILIMVDDMGIGDIPCFGKFMNVYNIFLNESRENSLYMTRRESLKPATSLNPICYAFP